MIYSEITEMSVLNMKILLATFIDHRDLLS